MRSPAFWERDGIAARLLEPSSAVVRAAGSLRRRVARPVRAPVPVICVGNVVAGGAGKTPVALSLLERLRARGLAAHAIARGYGGRLSGPEQVDPRRHGAADVGDEALLLARRAPAWVARDRAAAAGAATAAGAAALVLDDGLQSPALVKDLSLLVVDGAYGLGNGRVLPAGPLREPVARALDRVHAVVLMGEDCHRLAGRWPGKLLLRARLEPRPECSRLAGRRVLAFAGIARPEKLFASLEALGAEVVERRAFPDHHPYSRAELDDLLEAAGRLQALAVTTEKDAVRLPVERAERFAVLPVHVLWKDEAALDGLLAPLVGHARASV